MLSAILYLGGCASPSHNPQDPLESFNRGMFKFNETVDKTVIKPVAKGYRAVMPPPGRMMVSNFFANLDDVLTAVNNLLQFKPLQALKDCGRVLVNSTVGLYGLVDVASHVGLEKHKEDFGQTLGVWGIGSGPYLVLPVMGPSSFRDGIGEYVDTLTGVPGHVDNISDRNQLYIGDLIDTRVRLLDKESVLDTAVIDRYAFIRDAYLQRRLSQVYDGYPPRKKYDDEDY